MIESLFENVNVITTLSGGLLIGLSATVLLLFNGRIAGASGIAYNLFSSPKGDKLWRLLFLAGLVIGANLLHVISNVPIPTPSEASVPVIMIGGLLVGFGSQLGSGCTSGHGICGIARFSKRSIVSTVTFMSVGIMSVSLFRYLTGLS